VAGNLTSPLRVTGVGTVCVIVPTLLDWGPSRSGHVLLARRSPLSRYSRLLSTEHRCSQQCEPGYRTGQDRIGPVPCGGSTGA
jgi:hypothetical protein